MSRSSKLSHRTKPKQFSCHHACYSPLQLITPLIIISSKEQKLQSFSLCVVPHPPDPQAYHCMQRDAAFCNNLSRCSAHKEIAQFSVILQSGKCVTWVLDPPHLVTGCCLDTSCFSHLKQREGRLESH